MSGAEHVHGPALTLDAAPLVPDDPPLPVLPLPVPLLLALLVPLPMLLALPPAPPSPLLLPPLFSPPLVLLPLAELLRPLLPSPVPPPRPLASDAPAFEPPLAGSPEPPGEPTPEDPAPPGALDSPGPAAPVGLPDSDGVSEAAEPPPSVATKVRLGKPHAAASAVTRMAHTVTIGGRIVTDAGPLQVPCERARSRRATP